jgi:osmotically-inducible protein OsmY
MLTVNAGIGASQTTAPQTTAPQTAPANPAAQAQDATLMKSVQSRLAGDQQARSAMIEVTVKDGVVLLDGTAPSTAVKQRALTIARETQGIVQVIDRVRVGRR